MTVLGKGEFGLGIGVEPHAFAPKEQSNGIPTCRKCSRVEADVVHTGEAPLPHPNDEVADDTRGYVNKHLSDLPNNAGLFHYSGPGLNFNPDSSDDDMMRRATAVVQRYRTGGAPTSRGKALVDRDRQEQHGDPVRNMERFAEVLTGYFGINFTPHDAAMVMLLFKACRSKSNPEHSDNYDDLEGYTEIARRVVGV